MNPPREVKRKKENRIRSIHFEDEEKTPQRKRGERERRKKELDNTISTFGNRDFNVDEYVKNYFKTNSVTSAQKHRQTLQKKRELISDRLQDYVTENYEKFIDTTREVVGIESDAQNLHNLLSQYQDTYKQIGELHLDLTPARSAEDNEKSELDKSDKLKEMDQLCGEVDGHTYERKFEQSVELIIEALEKIQQSTDWSFKREAKKMVNKRRDDLVNTLIHDLSNPTMKFTERQRFTRLLVRLNKWKRAADIFLQIWIDNINTEKRKIDSHGELHHYIGALARVYFRSIGRACREYETLFVSPPMMSEFVVWSVRQTQQFAFTFFLHVFRREHIDTALVGKCIRSAYEAVIKLGDVQMELWTTLEREFTPHLQKLFKNRIRLFSAELKQLCRSEKWEGHVVTVRVRNKDHRNSISITENSNIRLTESGRDLYNFFRDLHQDAKNILSLKLYRDMTLIVFPTIHEELRKMVVDYMLRTTIMSKNGLTAKQFLGISANCYCFAEDLIPRMQILFGKLFEKDLDKFSEVIQQFQRMYNIQRMNLGRMLAPAWVVEILGWTGSVPEVYSNTLIDKENARPSQQFVLLASYLNHLRKTIQALLNKESVTPVLKRAYKEILRTLQEKQYWRSADIGHGGLQQFVLDLKFLVISSKEMKDSEMSNELKKAMDLALRFYATATNQDIEQDGLLFEPVWYENVAVDSLKLIRDLDEDTIREFDSILSKIISQGPTA